MRRQVGFFMAILGLVVALAVPSVFAHHAGGGITLAGAWVRETLPGKDITAGFFTLANDGEQDALIGVVCDAATTVELHRMAHENGQMKMEQVKEIVLPSHGEVKLEPGGLHLMLFGVREPLVAGKTVKLTLTFRNAQPQTIEVPVRALDGKK